MPFEIKLSQLKNREQFEQAVAEHVARLIAFNKEVGQPRPVAHPLIEASVKRIQHPKGSKLPDDYAVDYVIVDDTTVTPPLSLEDRKRFIYSQLQVAEMAAKERILPGRKQRLAMLEYNLAKAKEPEVRTPEEAAAVTLIEDAQVKFTAIELAAARAESAIEDLTQDTIDSWQLPELG